MKCLIGVAAASMVISIAACAGGAGNYSQPEALNSFYVEGALGYANTGWSDIMGDSVGSNSSPIDMAYTKNANGGFAWGADIGYNLRPWLAVELGVLQLPTTDMSYTMSGQELGSGSVKSCAFYLAGKLTEMVTDNFALFGKAGVNYENTVVDDALGVSSGSDTYGLVTNHNYGPFFAAGVGYKVNSNIMVNAQFARTSGKSDHTANHFSPNANVTTVGVQYTI